MGGKHSKNGTTVGTTENPISQVPEGWGENGWEYDDKNGKAHYSIVGNRYRVEANAFDTQIRRSILGTQGDISRRDILGTGYTQGSRCDYFRIMQGWKNMKMNLHRPTGVIYRPALYEFTSESGEMLYGEQFPKPANAYSIEDVDQKETETFHLWDSNGNMIQRNLSDKEYASRKKLDPIAPFFTDDGDYTIREIKLREELRDGPYDYKKGSIKTDNKPVENVHYIEIMDVASSRTTKNEFLREAYNKWRESQFPSDDVDDRLVKIKVSKYYRTKDEGATENDYTEIRAFEAWVFPSDILKVRESLTEVTYDFEDKARGAVIVSFNDDELEQNADDSLKQRLPRTDNVGPPSKGHEVLPPIQEDPISYDALVEELWAIAKNPDKTQDSIWR